MMGCAWRDASYGCKDVALTAYLPKGRTSAGPPSCRARLCMPCPSPQLSAAALWFVALLRTLSPLPRPVGRSRRDQSREHRASSDDGSQCSPLATVAPSLMVEAVVAESGT